MKHCAGKNKQKACLFYVLTANTGALHGFLESSCS